MIGTMPHPQRVPIHVADEADRAGTRRAKQKPLKDTAPIRCQLWDVDRLVTVVPVTINDEGHPSDVIYNPGSVEKITRLAFIWAGRIFTYPLPQPVIVKPGNPLHLALGHLRLMDKFGNTVIGAGR